MLTRWIVLSLLFCSASISALGQAGTTSAKSPAAVSAADAAIYERIRQYREIASHIQIDGRADDWNGLPTFVAHTKPLESNTPTQADPWHTITRVGIAVRDDDLLVMIQTQRTPSRDDWAFGLGISVFGGQSRDFEISFAFKQPHELTILSSAGNGPGTAKSEQKFRIPFSEMPVHIQDCVEIQIPFKTLTKYLPPDLSAALDGPEARPFLRVFPYSFQLITGPNVSLVDRGPAVASYRLRDTPYALDPPLPPSAPSFEAAPRSILVPLPVTGRWYLVEGPFEGTHAGSWGYDLDIVDDTLWSARVVDSPQNEDYYDWKQPVYAPFTAKIFSVKKGVADHPPVHDPNPALRDQYNGISLYAGSEALYNFVHFSQGSVPESFRPGQTIVMGTPVGAVGDTGMSGFPHLHIGLWSALATNKTLPLALSNVRIRLNPSDTDPWTRDLTRWEPRDGFFVERLP